MISSYGDGTPGSNAVCPGAGAPITLPNGYVMQDARNPFGITYLGGSAGAEAIRAGGLKGWSGISLAAVSRPADTIMIAEISKKTHPASVFPPPAAPGTATSCPGNARQWSNFADRHHGGNSVVFFDGHVKHVKKTQAAAHPEWFALGN